MGRKASRGGKRASDRQHKLIAPNSLAHDYWDHTVEHWSRIDEGVKLAFFATRVDAGRQGGEEIIIKHPSEEVGIKLLGVNTGQIPTEQRFAADDRQVIALAEALINSDVAVLEDRENSMRDPLKYLLLTLEPWFQVPGGSAMDHRCDLDLARSDRLGDYACVNLAPSATCEKLSL